MDIADRVCSVVERRGASLLVPYTSHTVYSLLCTGALTLCISTSILLYTLRSPVHWDERESVCLFIGSLRRDVRERFISLFCRRILLVFIQDSTVFHLSYTHVSDLSLYLALPLDPLFGASFRSCSIWCFVFCPILYVRFFVILFFNSFYVRYVIW